MNLKYLLASFLTLFVTMAEASSYLYVSSAHPRQGITSIELDEVTGELIGSELVGGHGAFMDGTSDFAIYKEYLYATNPGGTRKCVLLSDKSLDNCEDTGSGFSYPNAIALREAPSSHTLFAYIGNKPYKETKSSVSKCTVNANDGSLTNCALTGSQFDTPISIAFYKNFAYIANAGEQKIITRCSISSSGDLTNCNVIKDAQITQPRSIAINGSNAYIADAEQNAIFLCALSKQDGSLKNCKSTGDGFVYPNAIRIYHGRLYVVNYQDDSLSTCQIQDQDGSLNNCFRLSHYFSSPYRMIIYEIPS
ncbi:MAG: hypothetical protein Q8R24_03980 [Legionellaceae bacterium]|nr:hypothetical protein [Legionellaceae bacterium]